MNKETLQSYNERLSTNNSSLFSILEKISTLPEAGTSSGGASLNVFIQEEEPTTYEGVWVKTTNTADTTNIIDKITLALTWEQSDYPVAIQEMGVANIGTDIYYVGGTSDGAATNYMYKYDTVNNTYTRLTDLPFSAYGIGVAAYGTDLYIFGGRNGSSVYGTAYKYDTVNDTYTQITSLPKNLGQLGAVAIDNYIYIIGGKENSGYSSTIYRYNVLNSTYTTMASMPVARNAPGVCVSGQYIYIAGGFDGDALSHMYRFDTITNTVETLTNLPKVGFGYTLASCGSYVFVIGGYGGSTGYPAVYRYDCIEDTYTEIASLTTGVGRIDAVRLGDKIYVGGGSATGAVPQSIMQVATITSDYTNDSNTIILENNSAGKNVNLITIGDMKLNGKILNSFYYSTENGIDYDLEIFYGDGNAWNKY